MATRSATLYQGEDLAPQIDYTDYVIWEESEFGTRAYQGEVSDATVIIRDPLGEQGSSLSLPAGLTPKSLASKNLFIIKVGSDFLFRGRIGIKSYSRDGQNVERYRQVECQLHDTNWDLDHIFVHNYERPAENDTARVQGLIASYLSGSERPTTVLNGSNYLSGSNTVALAAQTYTRTTPLGVLQDIAESADKQFFVTGDSLTGGSLFYDGKDAGDACALSISDREDEVRADPTTVFAPIWNVGAASIEDGAELIDEVVLFYGTGEDQYVTAHSLTVHTQYGHASETFTDDKITTAAQASQKAVVLLANRRVEDKNYNVTIGPLTDAQVVQVKHGQLINIKARAIPDADDAAKTMRIVQIRYTTPVPGTWFAHLQLGRPWKQGTYGTGPTLVPQAPTPSTGISETLYEFLTWDGGPEQWDHPYAGSAEVLDQSTYFGGAAGTSTAGNFGPDLTVDAPLAVTEGWVLHISAFSQGFGESFPTTPHGFVNWSWGVKFYDDTHTLISTHTIGVFEAEEQDGGWEFSETDALTVPAGAVYMQLAQKTAALGDQPNATHLDQLSIYIVSGSGTTGNNTSPVGGPGDGATGTPGTYAPIDHVHEHGDLSSFSDTTFHGADEVEITDTGGYFDGNTVEAALQELGADTGATSPPENAFDGERPHGYNLTRQGLVISPSTGWKSDLVESPNVSWHPGAGKYVMVATGYDGTNERLGVWTADSPDGSWTEYGSNPFFSESGAGDDAGGVTGAYVWYEDGTSHLFYIGLTATGYEQGTKTICHATSTDWIPGTNAGTWTRLGAVISPSGSGWRQTAIWHPNIVKRGGTYYLFFNATGTVSAVSSERIGYATSPDLTTWTVDDANSPLLTVGSGWESVKLGDPYVYRIGETWYMAYEGYDGTNAGEGIAYTSDADFPLGWTKFADNPVLPHGSSGYDSLWAGRPCIWISPTKYYHWYSANDGSVRGIGLATEDLTASLRWEPVVTDTGSGPEIVFTATDIVMTWADYS